MAQDTGAFSFGMMMELPSIKISGPFDFMHAKIDTWVDEQVAKGNTTLVLDLSSAHYITAMGIACIFKILKKINISEGLLHISGATEDMIELITLGKLNAYVSYIPD